MRYARASTKWTGIDLRDQVAVKNTATHWPRRHRPVVKRSGCGLPSEVDRSSPRRAPACGGRIAACGTEGCFSETRRRLDPCRGRFGAARGAACCAARRAEVRRGHCHTMSRSTHRPVIPRPRPAGPGRRRGPRQPRVEREKVREGDAKGERERERGGEGDRREGEGLSDGERGRVGGGEREREGLVGPASSDVRPSNRKSNRSTDAIESINRVLAIESINR